MGESTLAIYLHGEQENWDPRIPSLTNNHPDAIVSANAGLVNYKAWQGVILYCHVENIPFAVTEYAEQSAEVQVESLPRILHHYASSSLHGRMTTDALQTLLSPRSYPIEFNPFQRPGQRYIGYIRLPNVPNGFTIRVVGSDNDETRGDVSPQQSLVTPDVPISSTSEIQNLVEKAKNISLNGLD